MQQDLLMGLNVNKITLNDPSSESDFFTILPSPKDSGDGSQGESVIVLLSALDSLGGA
jgi:hypothetical protein